MARLAIWAVLIAFAAPGLLFLVGIYFNDRPLHFPRAVRRTALIGTYCYAGSLAIVVMNYLQDVFSVTPLAQRLLGPHREAVDLQSIGGFVLSEFGSIVQLLLLVALLKSVDDELQEPLSTFLIWTAKGAVITGGIWVAFNVARLGATPWGYRQIQNMALQAHVAPPTIWHVLKGIVLPLLAGIGLFVAPYMVWRNLAATASRDEPIPETIITPT